MGGGGVKIPVHCVLFCESLAFIDFSFGLLVMLIFCLLITGIFCLFVNYYSFIPCLLFWFNFLSLSKAVTVFSTDTEKIMWPCSYKSIGKLQTDTEIILAVC